MKLLAIAIIVLKVIFVLFVLRVVMNLVLLGLRVFLQHRLNKANLFLKHAEHDGDALNV